MDFKNESSESKGQPGSTVPRAVVIIGARTGGPAALAQVIPRLPQNLPASVIVVQQMRPGFTALLAEHLTSVSEISVREAVNNQTLKTGEVLIVPGGMGALLVKHETLGGKSYHLELEDLSESIERSRSSIDHALESAAEVFGSVTIGVVLTGMGDDGTAGLRTVRNAGGKTIAQDEVTSILYDMPKAAISAGVVDETLPLYNIADRITELVGEKHASFLQKAAG